MSSGKTTGTSAEDLITIKMALHTKMHEIKLPNAIEQISNKYIIHRRLYLHLENTPNTPKAIKFEDE